MNYLNIASKGMPLTNKTLRFLQSAYKDALAATANLIGDFGILHGVDRVSTNVTDGWIAYNGELLPFVGGAYNLVVSVVETVENVDYNTDVDDNTVLDNLPLYVTRYATCGVVAGAVATFYFYELKKIAPIKKHLSTLALGIVYVGSIVPISRTNEQIAIHLPISPSAPNLNYIVMPVVSQIVDGERVSVPENEIEWEVTNRALDGCDIKLKAVDTAFDSVELRYYIINTP